jgi:hypothetical protein
MIDHELLHRPWQPIAKAGVLGVDFVHYSPERSAIVMERFCPVTCLSLAILMASGCTPAPPPKTPTASVSGTIILDGNPVPTGEIHFGMLGVPPRVLKIADGAYSGEAPVGENQVEVYIYKEGPPNPRYPDDPPKMNTVPNKYWGPKTTLKASVKDGEPNKFTFDLKSK